MKEQWRLLLTDYNSAAKNMAIDKAVMVENSKGNVLPTVRFYRWEPPAISIGYFQSLKEEVDLEECDHLGIQYVRRITGGGAVFHDKELTYSIVISESHRQIPKNIMDSYRKICGAIIQGLKHVDIYGDYIPINDIIVEGKKISGNAQTRKFKTVLQHGTILLDVDVDKMFSLLKVPNEKIKDKLIEDIKQRVTSIKQVKGAIIDFNQLAESMKKGFEDEFDINLVEGSLTGDEKELTKKFENECFSNKEWNNRK